MMLKSKKYLSKIVLPLLIIQLLVSNNVFSQKKYSIDYQLLANGSSVEVLPKKILHSFEFRQEAQRYITNLPTLLSLEGYIGASVDSVHYDISQARVYLYLGAKYKWSKLNLDSIEPTVLENIISKKFSAEEDLEFGKGQEIQQKLLRYYENNGYPFASVSLQNVVISGANVSGTMMVDKGILYHIDSIRIFGKIKIKNRFMQHYLDIFNGELYSNQKLTSISKRLKELPFMKEADPWNVTMLGSGAILNLYLMPKKSSQIDVLIGFLPSSTPDKKSLLTADVHLNLNNALGSGENILLNWQQLQPESPKLNMGYSQPYIFNSRFGINFAFNLYKQDSNYLQLNGLIGLDYVLAQNKSLKVFYQTEKSYLLSGGVDSNQVIFTKKLPANIDVRSDNFGLGYHFFNTDYRFNPRHGTELGITATAGIKKIDKNNDIINIQGSQKPPFDYNSLYDSIQLRTYRFRVNASAAQYFTLSRNGVLKTAVNAGILQSPQTFQNELFRLGGYQLLRGFDEESIYANRYAVATAEYRFLTGINSYFYGFSDIASTYTKITSNSFSNFFISAGLGLEFETKFGLLNLSYAVGKRNDVKFDIRNASKIHFGYINYF
jgi:outer membrane protein assembly factor BamA